MKTPRDILLARHQATVPKLDAIRRDAMAGLNHQDTKAQSGAGDLVSWCLGGSKHLWLELIWPCRRVWTGLATVWTLIFLINFSQRDNVSSVTGKPVRPGGPVMSMQAQQRWMNELFADRAPQVEAEPPKIFVPKPRTENYQPLIA